MELCSVKSQVVVGGLCTKHLRMSFASPRVTSERRRAFRFFRNLLSSTWEFVMDLLAILVSGLDITVGSLAALADVSRWRASPKKSIVTLLLVVVLLGVLVVPFCL